MNFERKVLPTYTSNFTVLDQSPMRSDYLTIKRSRRCNKERIILRSPTVLKLNQSENSRSTGRRLGSKQRRPAVRASESEILVDDILRHKSKGISEAALLLESTLHGRSFNHMSEDFKTGKSLLTHGVSLLHERDNIMEPKYQALLKDGQANVSLQDSESSILNKNKSNYLVSAHTDIPVNICKSDTFFEQECESWSRKTELSGLKARSVSRRQFSSQENQPASPDCTLETTGCNRRSYIDRARNMFAISKIMKEQVKFPEKCSGHSNFLVRTSDQVKSEAAEPDHEMYASYIGDHCRRNRRSKSIDRRVDTMLQRELDFDRSIRFLDLNAQAAHGKKITRKLFSPDTGDPSHRYITKRYGHRNGNDETRFSQNFAESNFNSNLTREKLSEEKTGNLEGYVGVDNYAKWHAWEYASYDNQDKDEHDGQSRYRDKLTRKPDGQGCYRDELTRKINGQSRYNELARKPDGQKNYRDELTWKPDDSPISYKDELTLKPDGPSNYRDELTRKQDGKTSPNKRRPRKRRLRSAPKQTVCSNQSTRGRYPSVQQEDTSINYSGIQLGERCLIRPSHCNRQGRPSAPISPASIFDYDDLKKPPWTCTKWKDEAPKDCAEEKSPSKWAFEAYSDTCVTAPDKYAPSNGAKVREDLVSPDAVAALIQSRNNENQTCGDIYGISDRISSRLPDSPKLVSDYATGFTAMQKMRMPPLLLGYRKPFSFDNDAKISNCAKDKWTCCIESNIRHRNNKVMADSTRYSGNGELDFHAKPMFSSGRSTRTSPGSQEAEICERAETEFKARTKDLTVKSESAAISKQKLRGEFETKEKHRKSSQNEHTNAVSCRVQSKSVANSGQPKGNINTKFTTREYANTEDIQGTFENMNSRGVKGEENDMNMALREGVERMLDKSRLVGKIGTVTKVNCGTDVVKRALRKLVAFQRTFAADMKQNDNEEDECEAFSYETYIKGRDEQSANDVDSDVDFVIKVHSPRNPRILAMYGHQGETDADTQDAALNVDPILKLKAPVAPEKGPFSRSEDVSIRPSRPEISTNRTRAKNNRPPPAFDKEEELVEYGDSSSDTSEESYESDPPFLPPDQKSVISCSEMSSTETLSRKPTAKEISQDEFVNFFNSQSNGRSYTSAERRRKKANRSRTSLEDSRKVNSETSCSPYQGIGKIKKKLSRTKLLRRKKKLSSRSRSRMRRRGKKGRRSPIVDDDELSVIEAIRTSYKDQFGGKLTRSSEKLSKKGRRKSYVRQQTPKTDNTDNLERSPKPTVMRNVDCSPHVHIRKDPSPPRSGHKSFMRSVSSRRKVRVRHSSSERGNSKSELRRCSTTSSSDRYYVNRKKSTEKVGKFRVRDDRDDRTESKTRKKQASAEYNNHTTGYYKYQPADNRSKRASVNSGLNFTFRNVGYQTPTLLVPGTGIQHRSRWTEDRQKQRNVAERGKNSSLSPDRIESSTSWLSSSETSIFKAPALQQPDTEDKRLKYYEDFSTQPSQVPGFEPGRELNIIHSCKSENRSRASMYDKSLKSEIASSVTEKSAQSFSETSMAENQATTSTFSGEDAEHGPNGFPSESSQIKVEVSEKPATKENTPKADFNTTQLNISIMKLYDEINKLRKQLEASADEMNTRPVPVVGHDPPVVPSKPVISPRVAQQQSCTSSASSCCWKDSYQSQDTSGACTPVMVSTDSHFMQYYERPSEASTVNDVPAKADAYTEKVEWSNVDDRGCQFNAYMKKYGLSETASAYFSEKECIESTETASYAENGRQETSSSKPEDRYFDNKPSRCICSDKRDRPLRDAKYWPNDTIYAAMTHTPLNDDKDATLESTEKSNKLESTDSAGRPSAKYILEHLPAKKVQTAPDAEGLYTSEPFASKRAAHQLTMMSCSDTVKHAMLAASQDLAFSDTAERPSSRSSTHDSDLPASEASTNKQKPSSKGWMVRSVESLEHSTRDSISSTIDKESCNTNACTLYPGPSRKQPTTEPSKTTPKSKETSFCCAAGLTSEKEAWVGSSTCEGNEKEFLHLEELNQSQNQGSSYEESHVPENVSFNIATAQMWCQDKKALNDSVSEDNVPRIIKCVRDILFGSIKAQAKEAASGSHQKHACPARSPARRKHSKSPGARSSGLRCEVIESQLDEICVNGYVRGYREERASSKPETAFMEISGPPAMCNYITKKRGNTEVTKPRISLNHVQNSPKKRVFIDNEETNEKSPFYGEAVLTTGGEINRSSMRENDLLLTSQSSPRQLSGVRGRSNPHIPAPKQVEETDKSIRHYSDAINSKTRARSPALEVSRTYSPKSVGSGSERSFSSSYIDEKGSFRMYEGVRKHVRREKSPNPGTSDQSVHSENSKLLPRDYDHFSRREHFLPNVPKPAPPKEENAMIESFESMMQQRRPCYVEQCGFRQKKNNTPNERRTFGELNEGGVNPKQGETCKSDLPGVSFAVNNSSGSEIKRIQSNSKMYKHTNAESREFDDCTDAAFPVKNESKDRITSESSKFELLEEADCCQIPESFDKEALRACSKMESLKEVKEKMQKSPDKGSVQDVDDDEDVYEEDEEEDEKSDVDEVERDLENSCRCEVSNGNTSVDEDERESWYKTTDDESDRWGNSDEEADEMKD